MRRNETHQSRKPISNCALHPTRARKLFRVFKFRGGYGRVILGVSLTGLLLAKEMTSACYKLMLPRNGATYNTSKFGVS